MNDDPMSIDDATETHPDIPPIVDERGYEAARQYVAMLEQRGVTSDTRNEQGALLLKLRRAMELYRLTPAAKREMDIHVMRMQLDNAESEAKALKERIRIALVYLTDRWDIESTPLHAIAHAVEALTGAAAPKG